MVENDSDGWVFSPQNWMGFQTVKFGDRKKVEATSPQGSCFPDLIMWERWIKTGWFFLDQECPKLTNKNLKQNPTTGSFPFF